MFAENLHARSTYTGPGPCLSTDLCHDGPDVTQCLRSQGQLLLHKGVDAAIASLVPHKQPLVLLKRFLQAENGSDVQQAQVCKSLLVPAFRL